MRKAILLYILLCITTTAQVEKYSFAESVVISAEGGLTIAKTDYKTSVPGAGNRGIFEYFFADIDRHTFGFRAFGGGQNILGEDKRKQFQSFRTGVYFAGIGFTYIYTLNNRINPYASAGLSYNWISTTQETSEADRKDLTRESTTYAYSLEAGTRFRLVSNFYFNFSAAINFLNDDLLDNTAMGINNDFYIKSMAGFSFAFGTEADADDDGIKDNDDACKNASEDLDGFEDYDGCPDPDNDKDGIIDAYDKCPDLAEDADGYEDNDGCPDLDNDRDGIPDTKDKCPNIPEDVDGFEDDDGCADLDNDADGILDVNDRCPELAEDFDGFEDSDGCADLDNDGDGIYDDKDRCPDQAETVNNFQDSDGCPDVLPQRIEQDQYIEPEKSGRVSPENENLKGEVKRETIEKKAEAPKVKTESKNFLLHAVTTFEEETSEVSPQAYAELDRIANAIKGNPGSRWRIEGYTDNSMPEKSSIDISKKRAQAIYKYLVSKGVSQSQLQTVGLGSKNPIESNDKAFGRLRNRRVEIKQIK